MTNPSPKSRKKEKMHGPTVVGLIILGIGIGIIIGVFYTSQKQILKRLCQDILPEVIFTPTYIYNGLELKSCALTDGDEFPCDDFGAIITKKGVKGW